MCSHPQEGQEYGPVDGALRLSHCRGGGQGSEVHATGSVAQVRVQAPLQGLIEDHLMEKTEHSMGRKEIY